MRNEKGQFIGGNPYIHDRVVKEKISIAHKGMRHSEATRNKMRNNNARYWTGKKKPHLDATKVKISNSKRGIKLQETGRRSIAQTIRRDREGRKIWKRYKHFTATIPYKNWRMSVFTRDNFVCQFCGDKGYLQAHHIKSWAKCPEIRYELDNGITLCIDCHKLAHKTRKEL